MSTYASILNNLLVATPELNSTSQVAIYDTIARVVAIADDNTITELNSTKTIIDNTIGQQRYGRAGYYIDKALAFQYGDNLVIDPVTLDYVYATIDTTKQIIKQAAFESIVSGGAQFLTLKVAAIDANTNKLAPLTGPQKTSFDSYFTTYEIPGLPVTKVSIAANIFNFNCTVTYYSTYDYNTVVTGVIAAMISFRDSYRFNGELFTNDIESYVTTNVPGVRNTAISNTTIDNVSFSGSVKLSAGYFDFITNFESNITYVPF